MSGYGTPAPAIDKQLAYTGAKKYGVRDMSVRGKE
jgi:hypothetical protein